MTPHVPVVALLTDFGLRDPFVGVMKGVLLSRAPSLPWVDITHEVRPQDVRQAAFHLLTSYEFFPPGTLFVAVVDPGVGTHRRVLYAETKRYRFLAPDNGLLSWVFQREKSVNVWRVQNSRFFLQPVSSTFHGRDVFAPVAAALARGVSPSRMGPRTKDWVKWPFPSVTGPGHRRRGKVLEVDSFGNLITNFRANELKKWAPLPQWVFKVKKKGSIPWKSAYGAAARGEAVAVSGSSGFLEISLREGSAAERLGVRRGEPVLAQLRKNKV